jgi:CheY-like chemotaxis protein/HPt (histidine-containing phosphotransfer) domain-containing protein
LQQRRRAFNIQDSDTGIGLTGEQISKLFRPFQQADVSTTRQYGGTGLGLSISKQLVERLGGEIDVSSEYGKGSTFSFSISTGSLRDVEWISAAPTIKQENKVSADNLPVLAGKILIVDDAVDNQKLLAHTLKKTGLELTMVDNGLQAVEAVSSGAFDLILLDMQMPVMDGYTAAKEIRELGIEIPIVAFSANTMKHDIIKCIHAGCTTHLPKPFSKSDLIKLLTTYLGASKDQAKIVTPIASSKFKEDPDSLEIILDFIEGISKRIEDIERAMDRLDFTKLKDEAHRFYGSAGLYGYPVIANLSASLELSAENCSTELCKEIVNQIRNAYLGILAGIDLMKSENSEDFASHEAV